MNADVYQLFVNAHLAALNMNVLFYFTIKMFAQIQENVKIHQQHVFG